MTERGKKKRKAETLNPGLTAWVITPARVDICPAIVFVEEKHSQHKNFNLSFPLFNMEGNQTSVIESSDSDIKKLTASAAPQSTKKSPKYAGNAFQSISR